MIEFFFSAVSFIGAFLLFLVQPMTAKSILPWFGGTPLVWTVCMMFFQGILLAGYAYAHFISSRFPLRGALVLHTVVIGIGGLFTRFLPTPDLAPAGNDSPLGHLLVILFCSVAVPFFALSATSPLVQSWFHRGEVGRSPYRLYAVSNVGSIGAVLMYPFLVEPFFSLKAQEELFRIGYLIFVATACVVVVYSFRKNALAESAASPPPDFEPQVEGGQVEGGPGTWIFLSAAGVMLLLSTTEQISRNLAVSSVFWMIPLCLYLLSFVFCFRRGGRSVPAAWIYLLMVAALLVGVQLFFGNGQPVFLQWSTYLATLFIGCMVCHGELYAARPEAKGLTAYYLFISLGGALGGVLTGALAPRLFPEMWEYPLAWAGLSTFLVVREMRKSDVAFLSAAKKRRLGALAAAALIAAVCSATDVLHNRRDASFSVRSFFGRLAIHQSRNYVCLYHGIIRHGCQWRSPSKKQLPTTYFGPTSGVGVSVLALREARQGTASPNLNIAVIGLGVGTSAAWGQAGDRIRFFEIDEKVEMLAKRYFTFLEDSKAKVDIVLGDARLSLEREAEKTDARKYDLLVIDAFSGDAIPLHLLTEEAFALYRKRLKPDGILAAHISNRYLNLKPLMFGLAEKAAVTAMLIDTDDVMEDLIYGSTWTVMTDNSRIGDLIRALAPIHPRPDEKTVVFTDQFSNLLDLL